MTISSLILLVASSVQDSLIVDHDAHVCDNMALPALARRLHGAHARVQLWQ